jgi:CSLREA domain-containing protein
VTICRLGACALAVLFTIADTDAATFAVTSVGDESNATDSSVICTSGSTTCTLREAILEADADGWGNDNPEMISFALPSPQITLQNFFLPVVFVNLTIDGRDATSGANVVISGAHQWRIFLIGDDGTALPPSGDLPRRISVSIKHLGLNDALAKGGDGGGGGAGLEVPFL